MTLQQLLRILAARKWTVVVVLVLACFAAAAALSVMPRRYVATAAVVVNGRGDDPLRASTSSVQSGPTLATQVDIIRGTGVARRVVDNLKLASDRGWQAGWRESTGGTGDLPSWIATAIAGGLRVTSGTDSNVVSITYQSTDPQVAAKMANAFTEAYLATLLELRTGPAGEYAGFFDDRIKDARTRLEAAQSQLASFEKSNDYVGAGKGDVDSARLAELSSQLVVAQAALAETSSRRRGADRGPAASPEVMQNAVVQDLKSRITTQEMKLTEMGQRLQPTMPEYRSAKVELEELKNRLAAEIGQLAKSLQTAEGSSASRVAEIQEAMKTQRQRTLELQSFRDRDDVLRKEVDNAQAGFDLVMQRKSQSLLESQARQSDASLLDRAAVPFKPTSPNVPVVWLLAVVGGLLLGVLCAFAREYFNPVMRSAEDIVRETGLPVLAIIPKAQISRSSGFLLSRFRGPKPALLN